MRNLSVFLAGVLLLGSAFALFSRATWGEPIDIDAPDPTYVQDKATVREEIRARKFVLVNEEGTPMGMFNVFKGQPSLLLHDRNEKLRAVVGVDKSNQPGIVLLDENGKVRVQIEIEGNESRLTLFDENGKTTFQAPQ